MSLAPGQHELAPRVAAGPARQRVPAVLLTEATKQFRGAPAPVLQALSLRVEPGEFVSILGPSGCGKSTLLRLIAGLSPLTSGTIAVDGMTPVHARESVSFIFQDATLLPWRTVRANIALGLELDGAARTLRRSRVDALLKLVELEHVADAYPRQLSGGMRMRVSIARALATSPRLLLMDEPFAALDEITRNRMNDELLRLHRQQQWTVLFVTHSVAEAAYLSDRVVVLAPRPGRLAHLVPVDLGPGRTEDTRLSEGFDQLTAQLSRKLREVERA